MGPPQLRDLKQQLKHLIFRCVTIILTQNSPPLKIIAALKAKIISAD